MQTLLRRLAALGIALAALFSLFPCQTHAVSTSASSAILMDVDSGRVLYEQNADAKMLIASTTKILTALVAIREGDLNDVVTVSREAAYTEGSSMCLKVGEKLTLETLLYGLLLCSGNDAAVAIAEHISGSQEDFAKLMNATAREIGMEHSSFANPNGLDHEDHYSTARDMARLACAAVENETLVRMASTRSVTIGGRTMTNHNKLLNQIEGCIGLKTGYTMAAGRTLVSCVERNGQRLGPWWRRTASPGRWRRGSPWSWTWSWPDLCGPPSGPAGGPGRRFSQSMEKRWAGWRCCMAPTWRPGWRAP